MLTVAVQEIQLLKKLQIALTLLMTYSNCWVNNLTAEDEGRYVFVFQIIEQLLERKMPMCPKLCFPTVDVRDVALAHLRCMTLPEAVGEYLYSRLLVTTFTQVFCWVLLPDTVGEYIYPRLMVGTFTWGCRWIPFPGAVGEYLFPRLLVRTFSGDCWWVPFPEAVGEYLFPNW